MFGSVDGGYIPVCLLGLIAGVASERIATRWLSVTAAALAPVLIAYAWFWVPELFSPTGGDSLRPWDLIATTMWSVFAVPTSLLALIVSKQVRRRH
jgi:hypothetical protein